MTESEIHDYPTQPTDYLPHVIARCVEKADRTRQPHRFSLNGATVIVRPGQSSAAVHEEVQRQWQAAHQHVPASSDAPG
ncbi:hypothetical protein LPC08_02820 [Roseomonas sp. OT10]|uniref:hypothetical protein n=1 Tax=Roseomonas cutis TaxID=2897332 RepID=UPI001E3F4213|nr:hypothetical protein [Roseomonas sp. OT10]UFN49594.1 hypothetical protein LPC08_02820 [Roseomonas sp. OT10]